MNATSCALEKYEASLKQLGNEYFNVNKNKCEMLIGKNNSLIANNKKIWYITYVYKGTILIEL